MVEKLARWFFFSVIVSLIPLLFAYIHVVNDGHTATLPSILVHGELLLISVALAADAVGDLIGAPRNRPVLMIFAGAGCIITIMFASLYFADVSYKPQANADLVYRTSLAVFGLCLVASVSCKLLAEEIKP